MSIRNGTSRSGRCATGSVEPEVAIGVVVQMSRHCARRLDRRIAIPIVAFRAPASGIPDGQSDRDGRAAEALSL
jgi:hypothetical protein